MRTTRVIGAVVLALAGATTATATPAYAGDTPGTYSNWTFDSGDGLSDVEYTITVEKHPGQASQIYWSNQVGWTNGHGGYAGMQTNADADRNLFLFSVWDVTEAEAGSPGSWCQAFGGEGEGMSCRIWHKWNEGDTYRFHYRHEGGGWWSMTVTDLDTGEAFELGRILVGGDRMNPGSVSWVEYYRWSDDRSSCETEPYSRAFFGLPRANNGSLTGRLTSTSVNGCPGFPDSGATVQQTGSGARHTLGIGNSVMGEINGSDGRCLDVEASGGSGTPVVQYGCHGGRNQAWVLSHDGAIRSQLFTCLTAGSSGASVSTCDGAADQQWRADNGTLVNPATGRCLDGSTDRPTLQPCNGGADQRWTTPDRP